MAESFKKRKSATQIASLIGGSLAPSLRARGFASSEVITRWPDFIGAQLAPHTRALQLKWPPRGSKTLPSLPDRDAIELSAKHDGATLIVAVSGGMAIDVQHMAPQIIQRINAALGWRCVSKLALRQQPVARILPRIRREIPLLPAEIARLEATTQKIDDENLRQAFTRLGKGVFYRNRKI